MASRDGQGTDQDLGQPQGSGCGCSLLTASLAVLIIAVIRAFHGDWVLFTVGLILAFALFIWGGNKVPTAVEKHKSVTDPLPRAQAKAASATETQENDASMPPPPAGPAARPDPSPQ